MKLVRTVAIRCAYCLAAIVLNGFGTMALLTAAPQTAMKSTVPARRLIDINHATPEELKTLPGIQDAYALRIVNNRPYANKSQLSTKGVLPAATYARIRPLIIAKH
jgi:DNA uptake protein ComE-like DNA-binding protein